MEELLKEQAELEKKIAENDISDPKWFKRLEEIQSLIWTNGKSKSITLSEGKEYKSERVTSFTRDRR